MIIRVPVSVLFLLAACAIPALHAQPESRFRLSDVTAFVDYYSFTPDALTLAPAGVPIKGYTGVGGSATLAYSGFKENSESHVASGLSLAYTPFYVERMGQTNWHTTDHFATLNWRHPTGGRWTYGVALFGALTWTSDALFRPTTTASLAGASATPGDLGSAVVSGDTSNNQVTNILTGAPGLDSPTGMLIYGDRMWSASLQTDAAYSYSSRTTLHLHAVATRNQTLNDLSVPGGSESAYLVRYTESGDAGIDIAHMLSPRTTVAVGVSATRVFSRIEDIYITHANVLLARMMGPNWFVKVHAGVAQINVLRQTRLLPTAPQVEAGGTIGYKTYAHTFLATVDRQTGDPYAIGASSVLTASGAWSWRRPGNPWWLACDFGEQRTAGTFGVINGWRATGEIGRRLSTRTALSLGYAFLSGSGLFGPGVVAEPDLHIARLSFVWDSRGGLMR